MLSSTILHSWSAMAFSKSSSNEESKSLAFLSSNFTITTFNTSKINILSEITDVYSQFSAQMEKILCTLIYIVVVLSTITNLATLILQGSIWGTNPRCKHTTSLYLNHIASPFYILNRNAQCHFTPYSLFSTVLFQQKGKEENEDDGLDVDARHLIPIFSSFTANGLNLIMRMWVRFKRPHRWNNITFHLSDTNGRNSERRASSLLECYPESWRTNPMGNAQL